MENNTNTDCQTLMRSKNFVYDENSCPVTATMRVIGGKWKPILINAIYYQSPARFGELRRSLKGITQTMLTTQLRELEQDGVIKRVIYAEIPPRVEYTLTEFGETLQPIMAAMAAWGRTYKLNQQAQAEAQTLVAAQ